MKEPVLAAITAEIVAVIGVLALFGVEFTTEQTAAIVALVAATYGLFALVRARVTPTGKEPS